MERPVRQPPLGPSPGLEHNVSKQLRLQTQPTRVCLLRPSRSLGLEVELPEGMAFTLPLADPRGRRSPGRVLEALGGGATAAVRAPGSNAFSPRPHLFLDRVLVPRAAVGVGFKQHAQPQIPLRFPLQTTYSGVGAGAMQSS